MAIAIHHARQVWRDQLSLAIVTLEPLPPRLPTTTRRALHNLVLEGLNNVARHQPGATAELTLRVYRDRILLTLTARGGQEVHHNGARNGLARALPDGLAATQAPPSTGGYGLLALRRTVHEAGGEVRLHLLDTGSVLEADLPRRPRLRRRR